MSPAMRQNPVFIPGSAGETFGHVLRTRTAGRFLFRESRYDAALALPSHYHPRPYFTYVVDGSIHERRGHAEQFHPAGSLHFHPPGEPHESRMDAAGTTCLSIVLETDLPVGLELLPPAGAIPLPIAALARRCLRELHAADAAAELALEAAALEMVATLVRAGTPRGRRPPEWLGPVCDYLHARALDRIRLADLAAVAGIHEVHLVRAFRAHLGVTPGAYLRGLRIEHARRALARTDAPLADIALEAGFSSQAHFTRVFHRLAGVTPAAFRRARRRGA